VRGRWSGDEVKDIPFGKWVLEDCREGVLLDLLSLEERLREVAELGHERILEMKRELSMVY
jgi:hypothetical protein